MNDSNRVVLIGGHGKVGLLAAGTLGAAGYSVDSII
ncbi:MAG TPA: NAD-dependent dehydratase, partial [Gammaproteobacteria bacterium]|nr:NAD-dependent dehydratase [Gammaproteobacteria bacterium]